MTGTMLKSTTLVLTAIKQAVFSLSQCICSVLHNTAYNHSKTIILQSLF